MNRSTDPSANSKSISSMRLPRYARTSEDADHLEVSIGEFQRFGSKAISESVSDSFPLTAMRPCRWFARGGLYTHSCNGGPYQGW